MFTTAGVARSSMGAKVGIGWPSKNAGSAACGRLPATPSNNRLTKTAGRDFMRLSSYISGKQRQRLWVISSVRGRDTVRCDGRFSPQVPGSDLEVSAGTKVERSLHL